MCYTEAWPRLAPRAPASSLLNFRILLSISTQLFLSIGSLVLINVILEQQSWFIRNDPEVGPDDKLKDSVVCMENAVTFTFANFPYVITALAFNTSAPFRKHLFTNSTFYFNSYFYSNSFLL